MADGGNIIISIANANSVCSGAGTYSLGDTITLSCTPNEHYAFVHWVIKHNEDNVTLEESRVMMTNEVLRNEDGSADEVISYDATFTIDTAHSSIFEEGEYLVFAIVRRKRVFTINVSSEYGTPFQSLKTVEEGGSVTIKARDYNNVIFTHWSDGSFEQERTFVVIADLTLVAFYTKAPNITQKYRAYVKDAKNLTGLPKAFMVVQSFTLREDLMTTANSTINVVSVPGNVDNGDIICVYDPKGKVIYKGIIKQIDEYSITSAQMQEFYKGTWIMETNDVGAIEEDFKLMLRKYANGFLGNSTYQDTLMLQEKGIVNINTSTSTLGSLESVEANKTTDMSKYIYDLYNKYGLILDFDFPYSGDCSVNIGIPNYGSYKIGTNANCISDMTPTTEIEETNKLVIFAKNGTYRATYYATTTNGIVKEPTTDVGRFTDINTKVVFSDDAEEDIVKANLPETMYNHYLSFELLLNNKLYDWSKWKLGQPLQVWNGSDYYLTVYTAYELTKEENMNPILVKIECGKVRMTLTKKLSLMGVQ